MEEPFDTVIGNAIPYAFFSEGHAAANAAMDGNVQSGVGAAGGGGVAPQP